VRFWRDRALVRGDPELEPLWWGLHAGIIGALAGGVFDHYFFNLAFHHSVTLFWLVIALATVSTTIIRARVERRHGDELPGDPVGSLAGGQKARA
jgi:hypothetical protein